MGCKLLGGAGLLCDDNCMTVAMPRNVIQNMLCAFPLQ
jgi:hypothetical protein